MTSSITGAIEAFNKTVQNLLILAKDAQKDKFNLEHSIAFFDVL